MVLGKDLRVKGLSSIRADADERGEPGEDRWYEEAMAPKSSELTGKHAQPRTA